MTNSNSKKSRKTGIKKKNTKKIKIDQKTDTNQEIEKKNHDLYTINLNYFLFFD